MEQNKEYFYTSNLGVKVALEHEGFAELRNMRTKLVRSDGKEAVTWWFTPVNANGDKAVEVMFHMTKGSEAFMREFPNHPVSIIRRAFTMRDNSIREVREMPRTLMTMVNGHHVAISETATDERKREMSELLNKLP